MGTLTTYLQQEFKRLCPSGWTCSHEAHVYSKELEKLFGYYPKADILLEREDGSRRYWIEFEVSRADPVANHAKYATGHLFEPRAPKDVFVAMVSPHVTRGRRNLASNAVNLMRCVGMNAFQTVLFPHQTGYHIKRLNEMPVETLSQQNLPIQSELDRLFTVTKTITSIANRRIHLAGDLMDVLLNLRQFNEEIETSEGRSRFGKRTITYFAFDPASRLFAPSKFCAYVAIPEITQDINADLSTRYRSEMTVRFYTTLDETDRRFDGNVARRHLENELAMRLRQPDEEPKIKRAFDDWLPTCGDSINIHPSGPQFLLPPVWF